MDIPFVTNNSGGAAIALTDTKSEQVTVLDSGACFGWLVSSGPVLLTAVEDTEFFLTHTGDTDAPAIRVTDEDGVTVTDILPGSRYPASSTHPLKRMNSITVELVPENGN